MNMFLIFDSTLSDLPARLIYCRSKGLLTALFMAMRGMPSFFLLSAMLAISVLATALLVSRLSSSQHQLQTELKAGNGELRSQQELFIALLHNGIDGIFLLAPDAGILYASPSAQQTYGSTSGTLVGENLLNLVHDNDRERIVHAMEVVKREAGTTLTVEIRCRRADGSWHWAECTSKNLLAEPAVNAIMTTCRDIEVYKRYEQDLTALAATDALTGLANYRRLMEILNGEIRHFNRTGRPVAILMLDLNGLKRINDAYGHLVGSRALTRLADVLLTSCRSIDTPARYGGDEFVVVLPESNLQAARGVAERIADRLKTDEEEPFISASVGIAVCPYDGETPEALLRKADAELYEMKAVYKGLQSV